MKKFKTLFLTLIISITMLSFTSCETVYATTCDDVYTDSDTEVTIRVLTTYGTPIYVDGVLSYYLYRDLYYYPYYYNNILYYRPFYKPLPYRHHYRFGRPHRGDIGHRHYGNHHGHRPHYDGKPGHFRNHKPNAGQGHHNGHHNGNHNGNHNRGNNNHRNHNFNMGNHSRLHTQPHMNNRPQHNFGNHGSRIPNMNRSVPSRSSGSFGGNRNGNFGNHRR